MNIEDTVDDKILSPIISAIFNSSKFKKICKTICKLRNIYSIKGLRNDQISEKITNHIFNTHNTLSVNWFNFKNTSEYYKIKNLAELDPKTIELALAINEELVRIFKKNKKTATCLQEQKNYSVDDMLDMVQTNLDNNLSLEKNTSSSSSENPSDLDLSIKTMDRTNNNNNIIQRPTIPHDNHNFHNSLQYNQHHQHNTLEQQIQQQSHQQYHYQSKGKNYKRKAGNKILEEIETKKKAKISFKDSNNDSDNSSNSVSSYKSTNNPTRKNLANNALNNLLASHRNNTSNFNQDLKILAKDNHIGDCHILKNGMIINTINDKMTNEGSVLGNNNTPILNSNNCTENKKIKRPREKDNYLELNHELKMLKLPQ